MTTLPDNYPDRLAHIIQTAQGDWKALFIALRDAKTEEERKARYKALLSDVEAARSTKGTTVEELEELNDVRKWLESLRPFISPGVRIATPSLSKP